MSRARDDGSRLTRYSPPPLFSLSFSLSLSIYLSVYLSIWRRNDLLFARKQISLPISASSPRPPFLMRSVLLCFSPAMVPFHKHRDLRFPNLRVSARPVFAHKFRKPSRPGETIKSDNIEGPRLFFFSSPLPLPFRSRSFFLFFFCVLFPGPFFLFFSLFFFNECILKSHNVQRRRKFHGRKRAACQFDDT